MSETPVNSFLASQTGLKCPKCGHAMTVLDVMRVVDNHMQGLRGRYKSNGDNDVCGQCEKDAHDALPKHPFPSTGAISPPTPMIPIIRAPTSPSLPLANHT